MFRRRGFLYKDNTQTESKLSARRSNGSGIPLIPCLLGIVLIFALMTLNCENNGGTGETFRNPPEIVSSNGVLDTTLIAGFSEAKIGNDKVTTSVYNGSFVPPTLRVFPGDLMRVRLENLIDQMTNLHYHGMNVTPISPSDDIFIMVTPTGTFDYEVPILQSHASRMYYYHTHAFGLTEFQIMSGLSGTLIVEGLLDPFPQLKGIRELIMDLRDIQIDSDGRVPTNIDPSAPTHHTLNGQVNPTIKIHPGETQLWRIANVGADLYYPLKLEGHTFFEIARDGNRHNQIVPTDEILLPPSSRVEVLIQGGTGGIYKFKVMPFNTGPQGDSYEGATLATLISKGPAQEPIPLPTQSEFPQLEDLCNQPVVTERTIVFSESADGNTFFINGKEFDPTNPVVDTTVKIGTLEKWTVQNTSQELHVFHIHQTDFQVCETNGLNSRSLATRIL